MNNVLKERHLIFSRSFLGFLNEIKDESRIARIILSCRELEYNRVVHHVTKLVLTAEEATYITFRSDGTISYLPAGKVQKINDDGTWAVEGRQNGKPAKVMRKIFTPKMLKILKDADFEVFNNKYKAKFGIDKYEFSVLPAEEIPDVYDADLEEGGGSLYNSCMRGHSEYMDIYAACKKLEIVVLKNKQTGRLAGRALLWDIGDGKFLDRFYVCNDHLYEAFIDYAVKNKWWYKQYYKTYDYKQTWVNPSTGEVETKVVRIDTPTDFDYYPYIDTFQYGGDGYLTNDEDGYLTNYTYNNTDGSRDGQVYDEIDECYIDLNDSVTLYDGRVTHQDNAVYCERGSRRDEYIPMSEAYRVGNEYWHESDVEKL